MPTNNPAMGQAKLTVLLVEDDPADAELVVRELQRAGFAVESDVVKSPEEFRQRIRRKSPDIVWANYNLGQWRGLEALEMLRGEGLDIPLILVSGALGEVRVVECIRQGATDYVMKDDLAHLPVSVRRALQEQQLRRERKRAVEALAEKLKELARSNRDLEQFAYIVSHDLQEPLRMVASYTQLLAERYRGQLDEQADKFIHYALEGAVRMQTLIQDLLAYSRVGRTGTELQPTNCDEVVRNALLCLQASIAESHAVVLHEPLPVVMGNQAQLQQVFQNLIGNAIKFRRPEPPVVQIEAQRAGTKWLFSVADNGIGIAPEHRENIFLAFKRLHTHDEYPGNGISLAICKRIVEQHSGRIWVESSLGGGAVFKFTLPAAFSSLSEMRPQEESRLDEHTTSLVG